MLFFDARLNALLAENADASKEKQYHLKRQILPGIAAYETLQRVMQVPTATWMSVMSQSSTNSAIMVWCIAAAVPFFTNTESENCSGCVFL